MELITLAIVGAIVSALVGFIKTKFGTTSWKSVLSLVLVSLVAGIGYWLIKDAGLVESSIQILISANLIYSLLWKQLER